MLSTTKKNYAHTTITVVMKFLFKQKKVGLYLKVIKQNIVFKDF